MKPSGLDYVDASRVLQNAMTLNTRDTMFASRGGEIVYIFDTNIIESFIRADGFVSAESIARDGPPPELFTPEAARISGRMTLQYLFSGKLAGQRHHPCYLSPVHWNEALRRVDVVAAEQTQAMPRETPSEQVLRDVLADLEALRDDPRAMVQKAQDLGVGPLLMKLADASSVNIRLQTAFARDGGPTTGIRDLTHSPYWTDAVNAILASDVRFWQARLTAAHQQSGGRHRAPVKTANVYADALTLAAIQALYRENVDAGGPEPKVRFLFVTADRTIDAVVSAHRGLLRTEGIPLFVRHHQVYMPLLNYSAMSDIMPSGQGEYDEIRQVFGDVERTVRSVLQLDRQDSRTNSWFRSKGSRLAQNIDRWSSQAERLAVANASYLASGIGDEFRVVDDVIDLLRSTDVRAATAQLLSETLSTIREDHDKGLQGLALARLGAGKVRDEGDGAFNSGARIHLKLMEVDFTRPLRSLPEIGKADMRTMEALIDRFRSGVGPGGFVNKVAGLLQTSWDDPEQRAASRLIASGIYFAVGAWESARNCAELCLTTLEGDDRFGLWAREARYAAALAIRMTLRSPEELALATDHLKQNIVEGRSLLPQCRDRIELATLQLTAAVTQTIELTTPVHLEDRLRPLHLTDTQNIPRLFDGAVSQLHRTLEDIEADERNRVAASRLRAQALVNLLGAQIHSRLLGRALSAQISAIADLVATRRALDVALEETERQPSLSAQVYIALADHLIAPSPAQARRTISLVERFLSKSDLSDADQREQDFLLLQLRSGLASTLSE